MNAPARNFIAKEWRRLPPDVNDKYAVSEFGDVCSFHSNKDLRRTPQKRGGYLAVGLWRGNRSRLWPVHQLVAIAFHGPRPSPRHQAAHFDGNKLNNTPQNVRWATREENEAHKKLHGTDNAGERNGQAKLTAAFVRKIKLAYASGERVCDISARFGVNQPHVSSIVNGRIWRHI